MSENYTDFKSRIKLKLGIDLNLYKEAQMKRRLTSLRNKRGYQDFSTYYQALDQEEELLIEFIDRMTINVSEFYRNPKRWNVLKKTILPHLLRYKRTVTIWSAACSTGEEPYSIAIMMREHFPNVDFKIIATDIDQEVLSRAKQGIYHKKALKELPLTIKNKYFTEKQSLYHIDNQIKQYITYKKHDLLVDKYPQQMDLIVCRNVLIYLTDEAKNIMYQKFNEALLSDGILFVGSTEQIFNPNEFGYSVFDTFFYQKL